MPTLQDHHELSSLEATMLPRLFCGDDLLLNCLTFKSMIVVLVSALGSRSSKECQMMNREPCSLTHQWLAPSARESAFRSMKFASGGCSWQVMVVSRSLDEDQQL
jgi:hypothetical protein